MKGDFSSWSQDDLKKNYRGVLHQQGKVLLDEDWNAQTRIGAHRDIVAAGDTIGEGVAAIPVSEPESFLIESAEADGKEAKLQIHPGRAWVNGTLVFLEGDPEAPDMPVERTAVPLGEPWQSEPPDNIAVGDRDAVVLEVWYDTLSAYQETGFLEPALGGIDTTERIVVNTDFKLLRLEEGESCPAVAEKVKDDFSSKGTLTVSLEEGDEGEEPCPVIEAGGYTGFEHYFYRVEIAGAVTDDGDPMFKWSRLNGSLTGRGTFVAGANPGEGKVQITANLAAVSAYAIQKPDFYVEILEKDDVSGLWKVTRGQRAVLNGSNLDFYGDVMEGAGPVAEDVFFRLWDDIRELSDFAPKAPLDNGLELEFSSVAATSYLPGDYWNFKARAGMMDETDPLPENAPPNGVHYFRVPLAILNWSDDGAGITADYDAGEITDCRDLFRPLIRQNVCCSFLVGDGESSHGDFDSIEEALFHLPESGGEICLLPGVHRANVEIDQGQNITIRGCGKRSLVTPREGKSGEPIFHIIDSNNIILEKMDLYATNDRVIAVEEKNAEMVEKITISDNRILTAHHAVCVTGGREIGICCNLIRVLDKLEGRPAIFIRAQESLIRGNKVHVIPYDETPKIANPTDEGEDIIDLLEECFNLEGSSNLVYFTGFMWSILLMEVDYYIPPVTDYKAQGGIVVGNGSNGIKIIENEIFGGAGNGITLGGELGASEVDVAGAVMEEELPLLRLIDIKDNLVRSMGLNGIAAHEFYCKQSSSFTTLEQSKISGNQIEMCLLGFTEPLDHLRFEVGFGGISLADCEDLIIRENIIADNGNTHVSPVCGIFIQQGDRIDISENKIHNNGPWVDDVSDSNVKQGIRGGIVIRMGVTMLSSRLSETGDSVVSGISAMRTGDGGHINTDALVGIKVHDNVVSQPLGHALYIVTMSPVSVQGNQLVSQGTLLTLDFIIRLFNKASREEENWDSDSIIYTISSLFGAVFILNMGISKDAIPALLVNMLSVDNVNRVEAAFSVALLPLANFPSGKTVFQDNITLFNLKDPSFDAAVSSQFIGTLDDLSCSDNHSECITINDFLWLNTVTLGVTSRVVNNRFQESRFYSLQLEQGSKGVASGLNLQNSETLGALVAYFLDTVIPFYSLVSTSLWQTVTNNQATNCIIANGSFQERVNNNIVMTINEKCEYRDEYLKEEARIDDLKERIKVINNKLQDENLSDDEKKTLEAEKTELGGQLSALQSSSLQK